MPCGGLCMVLKYVNDHVSRATCSTIRLKCLLCVRDILYVVVLEWFRTCAVSVITRKIGMENYLYQENHLLYFWYEGAYCNGLTLHSCLDYGLGWSWKCAVMPLSSKIRERVYETVSVWYLEGGIMAGSFRWLTTIKISNEVSCTCSASLYSRFP